MLTVVFGKSTMRRTQVQLWYNRFKKGPEDVNDDACSDNMIIIIIFWDKENHEYVEIV